LHQPRALCAAAQRRRHACAEACAPPHLVADARRLALPKEAEALDGLVAGAVAHIVGPKHVELDDSLKRKKNRAFVNENKTTEHDPAHLQAANGALNEAGVSLHGAILDQHADGCRFEMTNALFV
jgi:hypothetical protein